MDVVEEARRLAIALGADLKPVPQAVLDALKMDFAGLPPAYVDFLAHVGAGSLSRKFHLYDGLLDPDEIYDEETAARLKAVVLFGDDYQGYCAGFIPGDGWRVVEIDPTTGEILPIADGFEEFILRRLDKRA